MANAQCTWLSGVGARQIGWFASISFDASISEILMALRLGLALVVVPESTRRDTTELADFLREEQVDAITLPPQLVGSPLGGDSEHPRLVVTAGAPAIADATRKLAIGRTVVNAYGPAEAAVCATAHQVRPEATHNAIPIGSPIGNVRVYIVDRCMEPLPIGVEGELLIGGDQVSRGYIGQPGLTAAHFVADPFAETPGARLYRTGDLARWRPDGTLDFLGRADAQIKIRGMRVELGEIEAALSGFDDITDCAVIAQSTKQPGETKLVAYLVPKNHRDTTVPSGFGGSRRAASLP
ncbi:AMP-binding protein, partial [Ruegeria sp. 2205SS24-7]|uniref:AMP-binding protein n=1 Tax=Ruegeria discodermiae TaxID=3064389 RepID=UPI002741595C